MSCIQEQPTEGVHSTSRLSCKRAGKTRTLMPVWDSSGESQWQPSWEKAAILLVFVRVLLIGRRVRKLDSKIDEIRMSLGR
jgi:hypothetical protein